MHKTYESFSVATITSRSLELCLMPTISVMSPAVASRSQVHDPAKHSFWRHTSGEPTLHRSVCLPSMIPPSCNVQAQMPLCTSLDQFPGKAIRIPGATSTGTKHPFQESRLTLYCIEPIERLRTYRSELTRMVFPSKASPLPSLEASSFPPTSSCRPPLLGR